MSNPIALVDYNGLYDQPLDGDVSECVQGCVLPDGSGPPEMECDWICDMALYNDEIDQSGGGGVICYMGKKCPCPFPGLLVDDLPYWPGQCPLIDEIIKDHERKHFKDVDCSEGCHLHRPDWKPGVDRVLTECIHRRDSIDKLEKALAQPGPADICTSKMKLLKIGLEKQMKKYNCQNLLKAEDLIDAIK